MRGYTSDMRTAPLMTVVSASGGAGKSTIALLCACLAARAGVKTTLLEGDLQFGDYGVWLGLDEELPDLSLGAECPPLALADCLDLLKAPCFPEAAEQAGDEVVACLPSIRSTPDLVVADTGQFWNGLTAGLVCSSDLVLLVMDARRASVYEALKVLEPARNGCVPCRAHRALPPAAWPPSLIRDLPPEPKARPRLRHPGLCPTPERMAPLSIGLTARAEGLPVMRSAQECYPPSCFIVPPAQRFIYSLAAI